MRWWLLHPASLTGLLRARCDQFAVQPVFQAFAPAGVDECSELNLPRSRQAWVREVVLRCDDTPVVFAHSVVARRHLRGVWRGLSGLGRRSLGEVLFSNPKVQRQAFGFKRLRAGHALYERAQSASERELPRGLWARRSSFELQGQGILVTEVFLPAVLELRFSR